MLLLLIMGLGINVNAQSDRFFRYQYETDENKNTEWCELILLPPEHGLDYDYYADSVPLTSGLILMIGLSLGYGIHKNRK